MYFINDLISKSSLTYKTFEHDSMFSMLFHFVFLGNIILQILFRKKLGPSDAS